MALPRPITAYTELTVDERRFVWHLLNTDPKALCATKLDPAFAYTASNPAVIAPSAAGELGRALMKRINVEHEINRRIVQRLETLEIDNDYVLRVIRKVTDTSATKYIKRSKRVSEETGEESYVDIHIIHDPANALKGAELLGRHLKMFTDRTEITGKDGAPLMPPDLSRLTDAELAVLTALQTKVEGKV